MPSLRGLGTAALLLLQSGLPVLANIPIQPDSIDSLRSAGMTIANPMMKFYEQNQTEGIPGKLTDTWYIAGSMMMTWIQYWHSSGESKYNDEVQYDLMFQAGENYDYFSANYSQWLGNDDQMFWGLAAITASETGFPEVSGKPTWTSLARAVFQMQVDRWDTKACGGGLTWQIWPYQAGYTMKNAISNGGLFELSARLARFTKNETYAEWATKIWDWSASTPLLNTKTWYIADSTSNENNCKDAGQLQWTYNYGTYLAGAAFMYNYTNGNDQWLERVNGLLDSTISKFYPKKFGGNVMSEVSCEGPMTCDRNQLGFKGYLSMWMAMTAILVPSTAEKITPLLMGNSEHLSKQCSGESDNLCGVRWYQDTWDGIQGLEVQMAALGGITANMMVLNEAQIKTIDTNPNADEHHIDTNEGQSPDTLAPIQTGDRAGAWILTVLLILGIPGTVGWLIKTAYRCIRLQLACVGSGQRRYKFKEERIASRATKPTPAQQLAARNSPERIPSNDALEMAGSLIALLKVQDVRYDLSYYGLFFSQIPKYVGTSRALDASIGALVAVFPVLYTTEVSRDALVQYGNALKTLRATLQDPTESRTVGTMCAIYLIMVCEGWISTPDDPHVGHGIAMMHMLNSMVVQPNIGSFERDLMYTLAIPVIIHSTFTPTISLSPWLETLTTRFEPPNRVVLDDGAPFSTLNLRSLSRLPAFVTHPQDHYIEILSTYERMRADFRRIEACLRALAADPSSVRVFSRFQAAYCMLLSMAFVLNRVLRAFNPRNKALVEQATGIFDAVMRIAREAAPMKPVGACFVPPCLFCLWLCATDKGQLDEVQRLLAEYRPLYPVAKMEAWAGPLRGGFERRLDRATTLLHPAGYPTTTPPAFSVTVNKTTKPNVLVYRGMPHTSPPIGDARFHSFSSTTDVALRGEAVRMKQSKLSGSFTVETGRWGSFKWHLNQMTASSLEMRDSEGRVIAVVRGIAGGERRLEVLVPCQERFVELVVVTGMVGMVVTKEVLRAGVEGVVDAVGSVAGV
ncbi:hypothetical protein ATERTT37_000478 [Aspergillus terreus]